VSDVTTTGSLCENLTTSGLKAFRVTNLEMATCKAIVQLGPRKGSGCQFPPSENGYCGRHERNREYDEGIVTGKKWCRFFFRGCNNPPSDTTTSCESCLLKLATKTNPCQHEGCAFKVKEPGFCKKHERDKYYIEEKEKGISYCDIARGCFNILNDTASCDTCRDKNRIVETARYQKRKEIIKAIQLTKPNSLCAYCGKDFEPFKTRYNKDSVSCKVCSESQAKQDEKRKHRIRNFKNETFKNIKGYYKDYIVGATKRHKVITIDFDTFSTLVQSPCYYCGHSNPEETNGIDRMDNSIGYTNENCVSCCWICNRMKHVSSVEFFIEKCAIVVKQKQAGKEFFKKWNEYYSKDYCRYYITYKKEAEERGLPFEITETQWNVLSKMECYLCKYKSEKGLSIDRIDNTIRKYTIDNCRTCCGTCNIMKGEMSLTELIDQCKRILAIHPPVNTPAESADTPTSDTEESRKHWKAVGLYSAILCNEAQPFMEYFSTVYTKAEFDTLCEEIKETEKAHAIQRLQKLIRALKQRRIRLRQNPPPL